MEKSFGEYLLTTILRNNLTQKEAAQLLHVSPQALSNYILDKRLPDMKTMKHILQTFHLDANQVFHVDSFHSYALSDEEAELIEEFRSLKKDQKSYVKASIELLKELLE